MICDKSCDRAGRLISITDGLVACMSAQSVETAAGRHRLTGRASRSAYTSRGPAFRFDEQSGLADLICNRHRLSALLTDLRT